MATTQNEILYNLLTVVKIDLTDLYEGTLILKTQTNKEVTAFFWGQTFESNKTYKIKFDCIEYSLKWETIFYENKTQKQTLESQNEFCSYLAYGKIISINPVIVDFGDIKMEIGDWTHDDKVVGEFIYFKIDRLDILDVQNCN
jgi:hypothetical protein